MLDALAANKLAEDSKLYIYCDGPPENASPEALKKIENLREVVKGESRFQSVEIVYQDKNKGLAKSIVNGVSKVVDEHGKVIVMEDDIITSPTFLSYMNKALGMYENDEKVFSVSGYKPPAGKLKVTNSFFLPFSFPWGWATWKKPWQDFVPDSEILKKEIDEKGLKNDMNKGYYPYYQMLLDDIGGKVNSWFVRFYAYHMLNDGLCLYPKISLTYNIGFDDSGEHCDTGDVYFSQVAVGNMDNLEKQKIELNPRIWKYHQKEFWLRDPNLNFTNRVLRKLYRVLLKLKG